MNRLFEQKCTKNENLIIKALENHPAVLKRVKTRLEELSASEERAQYDRFVTAMLLCISDTHANTDYYFDEIYVPVGCNTKKETQISYDVPHIAMIIGGALLVGACIVAEFHPVVGLAGFLIATIGVLLPAWFANQFDNHEDIEGKKAEERLLFSDVHNALFPPPTTSLVAA